MFTNVGWGEILFLLVIGLFLIGPERLPRVIEDVRAAIIAARNAIENTKAQMNNEFGDEFAEFKKPLADLATLQRMGPKAALTKTLLDGDSSLLDSLDPKNIKREMNQSLGAKPQLNHSAATEAATAAVPEKPVKTRTVKPTVKVVQPQAKTPPPAATGEAPTAGFGEST